MLPPALPYFVWQQGCLTPDVAQEEQLAGALRLQEQLGEALAAHRAQVTSLTLEHTRQVAAQEASFQAQLAVSPFILAPHIPHCSAHMV